MNKMRRHQYTQGETLVSGNYGNSRTITFRPTGEKESILVGIPLCFAARFRPTGEKESITLVMECGLHDETELFRIVGQKPRDSLYAFVSRHRGLGYVGLQVISFDERENRWGVGESFFLQYDHQIDDVLGPRGVDLEMHNIAKRIMNWYME